MPAVAEPVKPSEPTQAPTQAQVAKNAYPDALVGKWARENGDSSCKQAIEAEKQTGMWDGLDIQKDGVSGMEFSCTSPEVTSAEGAFTIKENCAAEGDEFKLTKVYKLAANKLNVATDNGSGQKNQASYRLCK